MKSGSLFLATLVLASISIAQTNIFPSSGYVGIGTTSPSAQLDVRAGSATVIYAATGGAGGWAADLHNLDGGGDRYVRLAGGNYAAVFMNGHVGIGTTTPAAQLHLQASGSGSPELRLDQASAGWNYSRLRIQGATTQLIGGYSLQLIADGNAFPTWDRGIILGSNASMSDYAAVGAAVPFLSVSMDLDGSPDSLLTILGTNGNVGIGTTTPFARLAVVGSSVGQNDGGIFQITTGTGANSDNKLVFGVDDNGFSWIQAVKPGDNYRNLALNPTAGNVGIGTTSPTHKLAVNGTIRAKEVIVDTGWADYVFADDYQLAPLEEVEAHIREKKHLPGVPSAQEVAERGVSLGEMQALLLAKIEELTLHQIAQEKRASVQEQRLNTQSNQLAAQAERIALLEAENERLRQ